MVYPKFQIAAAGFSVWNSMQDGQASNSGCVLAAGRAEKREERGR